jgi:hypothetical protein
MLRFNTEFIPASQLMLGEVGPAPTRGNRACFEELPE